MQEFYLDLEVIPPQDREPNPDDVTPPANYKNPETIRAYQESKAEEAYRKLALDPMSGQVIIISVALGDAKPSTFFSTKEKDVFEALETYLQTLQFNINETKDLMKKAPDVWTLVGFNIASYDIPFLFLRAKKYKCKTIQLLLSDLHAYSHRIADVMRMAFPTERNKYVSMDNLCKFFGLEGKGDIDGSMVYDYFLQEKYEELIRYCEDDVIKTRQLYEILK
jgi:predicted PolB exonuclease-like 3'-5' exonuclease